MAPASARRRLIHRGCHGPDAYSRNPASLPRMVAAGAQVKPEPLPLRYEGESARRDVGDHRGVTGDDKTVGMGAILWRVVGTTNDRGPSAPVRNESDNDRSPGRRPR